MGEFYWYDLDDNLQIYWTGSQIHVGQSISQSFPAETKWRSNFEGVTAYFPNGTSGDLWFDILEQLGFDEPVE